MNGHLRIVHVPPLTLLAALEYADRNELRVSGWMGSQVPVGATPSPPRSSLEGEEAI
jgi:hypothetical protein